MVDKKIQIPRTSEQFLQDRKRPPIVSKQMATSVSQVRRGLLEEEVVQGGFNITGGVVSSSANQTSESFGPTRAGLVVSNQKLTKMASTSTSTSGGWRGSGGTLRQSPDIYSPLWLNSNLNLPRDRATINAWSRAFFALNGIVQSAVSLHSTYPISKLNIKCKNPDIEKFFADMIEEIDLMNVCVQLAQEYWILGEAFVYAELDEDNRKWSRLLIQNPDYMVVQRSVVADEPVISLRPDENLKRICTKNGPLELQQRQKLDVSIVEHVRRGENIPLNNFFISHLARKINPYDVRGTGLIVSSFRQLMLFDQLRECYDDQTEILTEDGFKKFSEIIDVHNINCDQDNFNLAIPKSVKVACFNENNNGIEYHYPTSAIVKNYCGDMIDFNLRNFNLSVTPGHEMWAQKQQRIAGKSGWKNWEKIQAKDIKSTSTYRVRCLAEWNGDEPQVVSILGNDVPTEIYLKFLGYLLSEGCVSKPKNGSGGSITLTQKVSSDCYQDIEKSISEFASYFGKSVKNNLRKIAQGNFKKKPDDVNNFIINSNDLYYFFKNKISIDGINCTSHYKKVPREIFKYSRRLIKILLKSLVAGDGSDIQNPKSIAYKYYTSSKQLANDVQELAWKAGYAPQIYTYAKSGRKSTEYVVSWSEAADGNFPILIPSSTRKSKHIETRQYCGKVYCVEVPTGLIVVRRKGKISIQGNCKFAQAANMINPLTLVKIGGEDFKPNAVDLDAWRQVFEEAQNDKDFKIFTHDKVTVERVGYNQGILDISPDITQLLKEIYSGLMVPSVLMDGGSDTSYANGSVALDVLRQRYLQFRNMLTIWL